MYIQRRKEKEVKQNLVFYNKRKNTIIIRKRKIGIGNSWDILVKCHDVRMESQGIWLLEIEKGSTKKD